MQDQEGSDVQQQILSELKQIRELLVSCTNDGMPLQALVPSAEVVASLIAAASLISRENLQLDQADLQQRCVAAQVLATELLRQFDAYHAARQSERLSALLRPPG